MLIQTGTSRTVQVDLRLAALLSGLAGAINAAGFRSLGFFSGNMTGNVSAAAETIALGRWQVAGWALGLVAAFITGSFSSALLIEVGRRREVHGIYAYSILAEAALMAALGVADALLPQSHADPVILIGVAFTMGLQNSATTRISDSRVRTTHVTGIATDIGVELAILLGNARTFSGRAMVAHRLALHSLTLACFLAGGIAGVLLYGAVGAALFGIISAALLAIAWPEARRARAANARA